MYLGEYCPRNSIKRRFPPLTTHNLFILNWLIFIALIFVILLAQVLISPMEYQGRDAHAVVATVLLMVLFLHCKNAQAATYTVGDASGWSFNTEGWTEGKTFNAGDVLGNNEMINRKLLYLLCICFVKTLVVGFSNRLTIFSLFSGQILQCSTTAQKVIMWWLWTNKVMIHARHPKERKYFKLEAIR